MYVCISPPLLSYCVSVVIEKFIPGCPYTCLSGLFLKFSPSASIATVCPVTSINDTSSFCNTSETRLFCNPSSDNNQLINNLSSNFCSSVSELFGFISLSLATHMFFNAAKAFLKFLAGSVLTHSE